MQASSLASQPLSARLEMRRLFREEWAKRLAENRLATYRPYIKQKAFHAAGAAHRERLLMAANQVGKTVSGAAEMAIHLTGRYPDWWEGRRWDRPIRAWAGSETYDVTRDGLQRILVGEPKDESAWGTGSIPKAALKDTTRRNGVADALDGVIVRHVSGGNSVLGFKAYEQGRTKWQAETLDLVWFDEEPPEDIYYEGLTRTNATEGIVYMTFTPLKGMSTVVHTFVTECGLGE
jgi:phage terminase large subunit-like protein